MSLKAETRFEHEKILGNLKLDFNIEKGRLRDEVKKIEDLVQDLDNKIGQESRNRKASLENEVQAMRGENSKFAMDCKHFDLLELCV